MKARVRILLAALVTVGLGCDRLYEGQGIGSPVVTVDPLPEVVEQCSETGTATEYASRSELDMLLEGVWEYCGGVSPLSRPGVAGLEIRPGESKYYFLRRQTDESLVRMSGFDASGSLEITPDASTPGRFRINLGSPANFTTEAEFTTWPRQLRFNPSVYVFRGGGVSPLASCGVDGSSVSYSTSDELKGLLKGLWAFCGGVSPLSAPSAAGIEIDPELGQYYFLQAGDHGDYVRATGFDAGGSLQIYTDTNSNSLRLLFGPPANFDTPAEFMTDPSKLRLNPSLYVRLP